MKSHYRKSSRAVQTPEAASTRKKPRRRTFGSGASIPARGKKPEAAPRTPGRQKEVLGILVMAFSLLWALSVVTYNPADNNHISGKSFWELFFPETGGSAITNSLGPVGAYLANLAILHFFGLASLLLNALLLVWGYGIMRKKQLVPLLHPSGVVLIAMAFIATALARIGADLAMWDSSVWAGALGMAAGTWLLNVLGSAGSYGILALILIVGLVLLIDRDIQRTLDRMESGLHNLRRAFGPPPGARVESKPDATTWEQLDDAAATSAEPASPPEAVSAPDTTDAAPAGDTQDDDIELKVYGQVEEEKASVIARAVPAAIDASPYTYPPLDLLDGPEKDGPQIDFDELEENKRILLDKLAVYKLDITDINAVVGPTVTLYELTPAPSVKIDQIKSRENDLAMAMAARGIRMVVPIPGKSAVGVEIPNRRRELVRVGQIIGTTKFAETTMELPIVLGKTIEGEVFLQDLTKMPHLLIAGATGSGKSVGLNALITGLLYACHPTNLKFVMVDPKKIELQQYRELRDHFLAIPEDGDEAIITEVPDALAILKSCLLEMEARYVLLSDARVRTVRDYNKAFREGALDSANGHKHLPYIVVIIDELADLMMTAGKDIEGPVARLAQMARAVGIHLVLATQRPSVDVITGLIKANFPSRVAFQVASKIDARTILDQNGAEQLVGNGDMLYMSGSRLIRLQSPFVSVQEIDQIMAFIHAQPGPGPYRLPAVEDAPGTGGPVRSGGNSRDDSDPLLEEAARIIIRSQQGSVSILQRKLSIGYTRAARIIDQLERAGVVGAFQQSGKAREVLVTDEMQLDALLRTSA